LFKEFTMDDRSRTTAAQREMQRQQDRHDQSTPKRGSALTQKAAQTGRRPYPQPPFPAQHIDKPGSEAEMEQRPQYLAPHYKGSGKLQGCAAVVTGGDSGIGRAVAVLFAREGADVAVIYLSEHEDAEETRRCVELEGRRCIAIAGDVRDAAFCRDAIEKIVTTFGRLDILVNNAAFQEHAESLLDLTEERFDHTMKTNVYGYFHMAKAALPHLKASEHAAVLNMPSVGAFIFAPMLAIYASMKAAMMSFTRSMAAQLVGAGIRVNALAPGPVDTDMMRKNPQQVIDGMIGGTLMRRLASTDEMVGAALLLTSDAGSYMTGQVIMVDGGGTPR
jgi:NAD(P)-dependent dehydrogenase (short-subunit alcohol dehydrogenase family)